MSTLAEALCGRVHPRWMSTFEAPCLSCDHLAAVAADWLRSDEAVEVVRSAFRGDDYEENAMGAAQEGEWSWFGWLATQQLAALAAHAKGDDDEQRA